MPEETQKFASMTQVVMKKEELLTRLIENKAKHDAVLAAAIEGYWEIAKAKIAEKRKKLLEQVEAWQEDIAREINKVEAKIEVKEQLPAHINYRAFQLDTALGLAYPQDHSKDYDRAIRMMQASIFEQVELSADEFDSYVLNNWEWKQNFLGTNSVYLGAIKGKLSNRGPRGAQGSVGYSGVQGDTYNNAADGAWATIACSGALPAF